MSTSQTDTPPPFGSDRLRLPDELRGPLKRHLAALREHYRNLEWAGNVGFGERPAIVVIDLARFWTDPECFPMGSDVDSVVDATVRVLEAGRRLGAPIFFTTYAYDPADPASPHDAKLRMRIEPGEAHLFELDARLGRRPTEKIIAKKYASAFKATNLHECLTALGVDTLIVTGVSTSHCVYATCRDATDSFRVIVPREAVGERCEIMHEVNLLDIEIDLADVLATEEVVGHLDRMATPTV